MGKRIGDCYNGFEINHALGIALDNCAAVRFISASRLHIVEPFRVRIPDIDEHVRYGTALRVFDRAYSE